MGLDLYCGEATCHTSYSGVHSIRLDIIKAVLKYIQENKEKILNNIKDKYGLDDEYYIDYYNRAIKYLNKLITPSNSHFINKKFPNYQVINNTDDNNLKIVGIYSFIPIIHHSDCDGYYTYGEVVEFFELLQKIYIYIEKDNFYDDEVKLERFILYDVLKECYDTQELITFC